MIPDRPRVPSGVLGLDWVTTDDGSLTLFDTQLQESFHSGCGAVAESLIVYLFNSGIFGRISRREPTRVFELGLGTCTNFLLTAALAEHFQVQLDYWCVENRLLPSSVIRNLNLSDHLPQAILNNFPAESSGANQRKGKHRQFEPRADVNTLLPLPEYFFNLSQLTVVLADWIDQQIESKSSIGHPRQHCLENQLGTQFVPFQYQSERLMEFTTLHLLVGDGGMLPEFCMQEKFDQQFSAVYFDPFCPETTPRLWSRDVLYAMYRILTSGGSLCSYCVKSRIRRDLQDIGFRVDRVPGPVGGKREVLVSLK